MRMADTKSELKKLIPCYCKELDNVDVSKYDDYQFSEKYLTAKEKLIKRQSRVYYPLIKTTGRRIASAVVAAALMGTITVAAYEPARSTVRDLFVRIFKGYSIVTVTNNADNAENRESAEKHKEKIEYVYRAEVPSDFVLSESETVVADTYASFNYYNEEESKYLFFNQYTYENYKTFVDNEKDHLEKKTDDLGNEILVYNYDDVCTTVIWDNGEYVFELTGDMTEEEIMKIYYTVK